MGLLIDGEWHDEWYDTNKTKGRFDRKASSFRKWVEADKAAPFPAEPGRYHLYVSLACPWAHRTLIVRKLKRLENVIGVSTVRAEMLEHGWEFGDGLGSTPDAINGAHKLHELYVKTEPNYTGRVTVPVLWDTRTSQIVNNESSEILRMFNSAFDAWGDGAVDLYPEALRSEIDEVNERVYHSINNGVYRCGFATSQSAYDEAASDLFEALDEMEARLATRRYLLGDVITEADWRLFVTLARFDAVYYSHFKCNIKALRDYPSLWGYTRDLFQYPGVAETLDLDHVKIHYYVSQRTLNPSQVVPQGPALDFHAPHDRARLSIQE